MISCTRRARSFSARMSSRSTSSTLALSSRTRSCNAASSIGPAILSKGGFGFQVRGSKSQFSVITENSPPGAVATCGRGAYPLSARGRRPDARSLMPLTFRSELDPLAPYRPPHPSQEAAAERGTDGFVKLTSNELSFGPLPEAEAALAEALPRANRYPDRHAGALREAVAEANTGTDPRLNVLVGNGSSEVLLNLLQLVQRPGEVVFPWPSFSLYVAISTTLGLSPKRVPLTDSHTAKPEALLSAVTEKTRAVILSNPNNPTGTYLDLDDVRGLADVLPEGVLLILDEAYQEFVSDPAYHGSHALALAKENVVCVRTFRSEERRVGKE